MNIKRKIALILSVVLLCSFMCLTANAEGEPHIIDTNELYVEIPAEYELCPFSEDDLFYTFVNENSDWLYVEAHDNDLDIKGMASVTEEEAKYICGLEYIAGGDTEELDLYDITYTEVSKVVISGINYYYCEGSFVYEGSEDSDKFGVYMFANKDILFFIGAIQYAETFDYADTLDGIVQTVRMNGKYLSGDKPTYTHEFASESFEEVVESDVKSYFNEYYEDEEYEDYEDYDETLGDLSEEEAQMATDFATGFIYAFAGIPMAICGIIAVVLIVKFVKNKKKSKELQEQLAFRPYSNGVNPQFPQPQPYGQPQPQVQPQPVMPQPVQPQVQPQPIPQPQVQPQPQPIPQAQPENQQVVLNGEPQNIDNM